MNAANDLLCIALCVLSFNAGAATLDHDAVGAGNNFAKAAFRFWCADDLAAVSGVAILVPGQDGDGRGMVADPTWQKFARDHKFALVACYFTDKQHDNRFIEDYALAGNGSGQALLDALADFAKTSKHDEVTTAPLIMWGHSAGGQFNYEFACWKPERVAAFVVNKGGVYFTHLASDAARKVPGIFFIGENDLEFRKMSILGIYAQNRRAHALWTLAIEPKTAHEVGHTRETAIAFFEAVLPQRLNAAGTALVDIKEETGWVGNLKSFEIRSGKMEKDEWSTWLPSENFARTWVHFVNAQSGAQFAP